MSRLTNLPSLLRGETVVVLTPSASYDEHMEEVETWGRTVVENVLVAPGSTSDVDGSTRPHGTRASLTLGFPRGFSAPLRGCRVVVRPEGGEGDSRSTYAVIGDPKPCGDGCPTAWRYTVEVEAIDG